MKYRPTMVYINQEAYESQQPIGQFRKKIQLKIRNFETNSILYLKINNKF